MGLFDTLLSLLGLADSSADDEDRGATVSVEREARTDTGAAAKGTDMEAAEQDGDAVSASAGTSVDGAGAAEPAEAAGPEGGVETELGTTEAESEGETTAEHRAAADEGTAESPDVIKGIGPAYADRLSEAGVDSVADLSTADADDLAEAIGLSPKRVGRWIERARDR
ncbi:helix-hairpin-helix domain-containing protein [Haloplanus sp.]|uniref:helix-hairpin-helix domain-containing protein n=1 Tax=Haloplanus sp. TaxID=1961696 RepID=UPI00261A990A|nr:helix-hairpin-helix domain-containing protein [Haloplanus sp.]